MTDEKNKSTKATSAEEIARKLVSIEEVKSDENSNQVVDSVSQLPDRSEETPVVRKLVVPDATPTSADPDDDRSPGGVGRSVGEELKPEEKSQLATEADESKA